MSANIVPRNEQVEFFCYHVVFSGSLRCQQTLSLAMNM